MQSSSVDEVEMPSNWLWPAFLSTPCTTPPGGKAAGSRWHELWVQQPQSTTTKL